MKITLEYSESHRCFRYREEGMTDIRGYRPIVFADESVIVPFTRKMFMKYNLFPETAVMRMEWLIFSNLENCIAI